VPNKEKFRVYRVAKGGEEVRQDMIVGHPERGWVCATETSQNRARQWALIFSQTDSVHTFEVREVTLDSTHVEEVAIIRFKRGKGFL
jgi:hypothetical protein